MGEAKPAEWYDEVYRTDAGYQQPPELSPWRPLWDAIIERIPPSARILELGCGPGHMAELLSRTQVVQWYLGADFSTEAIRQARARRLPIQPHYSFHVLDLRGQAALDFVGTYRESVVIACEVLEHLPEPADRRLVEAIVKAPSEQIIITLPTKDSESHARYFATERMVRARYETFLPNMTITRLDQWWIVEQRRSQ